MASTESFLCKNLKSDLNEVGVPRVVSNARHQLQSWMKSRNYCGYEPYDLLNSPYLSGRWTKRRPFNILLIQLGKRFAGAKVRKLLRMPPSVNPKALGLAISGYCDLARCGEDWGKEAKSLKAELVRLRSPNEKHFCWGYDWDFYSLRGPLMPAFSPNSIATYFCASALLDLAETFDDADAQSMAESAGKFFVERLNRSVDLKDQLCFSYTPSNRTMIYNSSALVSCFLARLAHKTGNQEYFELAQRSMNYLAAVQHPDGSWSYGSKRRQSWIDHFHTGYNLWALHEYMHFSGDNSFERVLTKGYEFYKRNFFVPCGAPKYFHNSLYPIDIHSCSQAILTFCAFAGRDPTAANRALQMALWTIHNMRGVEGAFYYQRHRVWANRTPYMRWGQAWMFRALAHLEGTTD